MNLIKRKCLAVAIVTFLVINKIECTPAGEQTPVEVQFEYVNEAMDYMDAKLPVSMPIEEKCQRYAIILNMAATSGVPHQITVEQISQLREEILSLRYNEIDSRNLGALFMSAIDRYRNSKLSPTFIDLVDCLKRMDSLVIRMFLSNKELFAILEIYQKILAFNKESGSEDYYYDLRKLPVSSRAILRRLFREYSYNNLIIVGPNFKRVQMKMKFDTQFVLETNASNNTRASSSSLQSPLQPQQMQRQSSLESEPEPESEPESESRTQSQSQTLTQSEFESDPQPQPQPQSESQSGRLEDVIQQLQLQPVELAQIQKEQERRQVEQLARLQNRRQLQKERHGFEKSIHQQQQRQQQLSKGLPQQQQEQRQEPVQLKLKEPVRGQEEQKQQESEPQQLHLLQNSAQQRHLEELMQQQQALELDESIGTSEQKGAQPLQDLVLQQIEYNQQIDEFIQRQMQLKRQLNELIQREMQPNFQQQQQPANQQFVQLQYKQKLLSLIQQQERQQQQFEHYVQQPSDLGHLQSSLRQQALQRLIQLQHEQSQQLQQLRHIQELRQAVQDPEQQPQQLIVIDSDYEDEQRQVQRRQRKLNYSEPVQELDQRSKRRRDSEQPPSQISQHFAQSYPREPSYTTESQLDSQMLDAQPQAASYLQSPAGSEPQQQQQPQQSEREESVFGFTPSHIHNQQTQQYPFKEPNLRSIVNPMAPFPSGSGHTYSSSASAPLSPLPSPYQRFGQADNQKHNQMINDIVQNYSPALPETSYNYITDHDAIDQQSQFYNVMSTLNTFDPIYQEEFGAYQDLTECAAQFQDTESILENFIEQPGTRTILQSADAQFWDSDSDSGSYSDYGMARKGGATKKPSS